MKKKYTFSFFCSLFLVLSLMLQGCGQVSRLLDKDGESVTVIDTEEETSEAPQTAYQMYYLNQGETRLMTTDYELTSGTTEGIIEECLAALRTAPLSNEDYKAPLAEGHDVQRFEYLREDKEIRLYFETGYNELSKTTEMLIRVAVVKTLTQFSGIVDYVSFYIGNEPLRDRDGQILEMTGSMYAETVPEQ